MLRNKILLAIVSGCRNTRQIAEWLNMPFGTVRNYFYYNGVKFNRFTNGDLVQWESDKCNTLQRGPNLAVRYKDGQPVAVGRVEVL